MITETNDWKIILGWLIAEKPVEVKDDDGKWVAPDWLRIDAAYHLVTKSNGWTFRLKPRTVKIGSREVEAPVLKPEVGDQVHFMNTWSVHQEVKIDSIRFNPKNNPKAIEQLRANGLLFASETAALAAHDAIHALLRGESC